MRSKISACILLLVLMLLFTSCRFFYDLFGEHKGSGNTNIPTNPPVGQTISISYNDFETTPNEGGVYYKIPDDTTGIILTDLPLDKMVKLVRVNPTTTAINNVSTVSAYSYDASADNSRRGYGAELDCIEEIKPSFDYSASSCENDGNLFEIPFIDDTDYAKLEREYKENYSSRMVEPNRMVSGGQSFSEGATKTFQVSGVTGGIPATLKAVGTNCYVWVSNGEGKYANYDSTDYGESETRPNDDNKITTEQAQELANAFDGLYDLETSLIGESYTTNPNPSMYIMPQSKISILVYDIEGDYSSNQKGGTFGMFWGGDLYNASVQADANEMELLDVDSYFTDRVFASVLSTVAHEFEHMLYFVNKWIKQRITISETWYTEMGAMMAEDCLAKYLSDAYPEFVVSVDSTLGRLKTFNSKYYSGGLAYWGSGEDALTSYAIAGIFGCWLQRNYGGGNLINQIVNNDATNEESITKALSACGYSDTFSDALLKFALSWAQPEATEYKLKKSTTGTYALFEADPWNKIYSNVIQNERIFGPVYVLGNYSGTIQPYGFWVSGWEKNQVTGIIFLFDSVSTEDKYIVITD